MLWRKDSEENITQHSCFAILSLRTCSNACISNVFFKNPSTTVSTQKIPESAGRGRLHRLHHSDFVKYDVVLIPISFKWDVIKKYNLKLVLISVFKNLCHNSQFSS
jgi:hypothetical protein